MNISTIKEFVMQVAPSYPVISIDLFGSYANDEATDGSDIDLLVCFDERSASLFDLAGFRLELQDKTNKKVDVVAGPLKDDSYLVIRRKVRIYESKGYSATSENRTGMQ